jgi:hypothetical protein
MANYIQGTNINANKFVTPTSRYIDSQVLYYSEQNYLTFETYKRQEYQESSDDRYMVITAGRQYRPDLVSNEVYGTVDYWWKIMEVNGIFDIYNFVAGLNIRLPKNIYG